MQTAEPAYTYVPTGSERPAPYPDGFIPDARRWSGREYERVIETRGPNGEPPVLHDGVPDCEPAPPDASRTTARTSAMVRYIAADRLPARRLIELRHVTHDPGMLALHGERLHGAVPLNPGAMTAPLDPDPWVSPEPRLHEVHVGAVLVAFDRETESTPIQIGGQILGHERHPAREAHIRAWRVPPAGPPVLVYDAWGPKGDEHLSALSGLLDEPLEGAFLGIADRYAGGDPPPAPHRVTQMRAAIDRWRFADAIARESAKSGHARPGGRRRKRRGRKSKPEAPRAPRPGHLLKAA